MPVSRVETLEPEDLESLGRIFDETWAFIGAAFEDADPETRAEARTRLASLLLELAGKEASYEHVRRVVLHIYQQTPRRRAADPREAQLSST